MKVKVNAMPRTLFFPKMEKFDTSLYLAGWGGGSTDAEVMLTPVLRNRGEQGVGVSNYGGSINNEADALAAASTIETDPIGPSIRRYANSAAVIETALEPSELLGRLKQIVQEFGRRPGGQRWRARVLDLDIVLWSGGAFASEELTIPHPLFRTRPFVVLPAAEIAPDWRDPLTGRNLRQLRSRLTRPRALPR